MYFSSKKPIRATPRLTPYTYIASEAICKSTDSIEESVRQLNTAAKAMQTLEPRDEVEGQLVAQLVVLHEQSMSWLSRAMKHGFYAKQAILDRKQLSQSLKKILS